MDTDTDIDSHWLEDMQHHMIAVVGIVADNSLDWGIAYNFDYILHCFGTIQTLYIKKIRVNFWFFYYIFKSF